MQKLALLLTLSIMLGCATGASAAETLRHVVAFKFKNTASPADVQKVEKAFKALKKKIPTVKALEWGTNISPEKHDKGFTHCWILTFKSEKDRDAYLVHPEHKGFGEMVGQHLEDVFVMDFWAK